jgi:hypothetical protein
MIKRRYGALTLANVHIALHEEDLAADAALSEQAARDLTDT